MATSDTRMISTDKTPFLNSMQIFMKDEKRLVFLFLFNSLARTGFGNIFFAVKCLHIFYNYN